MASTNKTANYNLSQFISTDKPAWLSDYNQDMNKIDTGIKGAADAATAADGKADANTNAIGDIANLTTTAKTNIVAAVNEVKTDAGTAQGTANTAVNVASAAQTNVTTLVNKFDLSTNLDYTNSSVTTSNVTLESNSHLYIARNNDGSLFKVYGRVRGTLTGGNLSTMKITLTNTGIPTDTDYQIICAGFGYDNNSVSLGFAPATITVKNNTIEIECIGRNNGALQVIQLSPCLYFNSNFGDLPTPE